ncbi:MAG: DUF3090 family protein [Dehalococcoidia bacterium]|nr:DUF3090 family protein [Dehalococcoidia bacterium]
MDASKAKYRFGSPSRVTPEAIGEPGKRTFRLILESGAASASLWLEKEQLYQLAIYIQEIGSSLSDADDGPGGTAPEPQWSGGPTNVEFKVGRLALGHDGSNKCFLLLAHDAGAEDEGQDEDMATLSFWLTASQGRELAAEALKVCAAGRPRCFLCGKPIDADGHMCPRGNGHGPVDF